MFQALYSKGVISEMLKQIWDVYDAVLQNTHITKCLFSSSSTKMDTKILNLSDVVSNSILNNLNKLTHGFHFITKL